MQKHTIVLGLLALMLTACSDATVTLVPPTLTPVVEATATPTATPAPTNTQPVPTWTPTPTASPVATLDAVDLLTFAGHAIERIQAAADAELVCIRYEDTDADGDAEWFALTGVEGDPGHLDAYILDGEVLYGLEPAVPKPGIPDVRLGQYPVCDVFIRDVNLDGLPEIGIYGHTIKNETLLHLFVWDADQQRYRRLGYFSGDAGIHLVNVDGDLPEEIWEGYRDNGAPDLAWYVIHTWRDGTFGWTSDTYDWYFADRPQTYPTHKPEYAVISFYLALDERDLPGAYAMIDAAQQPDYAAWVLGYAQTLKVSVGGVHTIPAESNETRAAVAAMVTAWDNDHGVISARLWDVEWTAVNTPDGWRLASSTAEVLDEWRVNYLP